MFYKYGANSPKRNWVYAIDDVELTAIPEPATFVLTAVALPGPAVRGRQRKR